MSTLRIDTNAKVVVERFVKPSHPNGLQTNADDIAKRMNPHSISEVNRMMIAAGRSCFKNDDFSADIFEYLFNETFIPSQMEIFTASLASTGSDLADTLNKIGESTDSLSDIQSKDVFNIRIAPLHDEFQRRYEQRRVMRDKLRGSMKIHVIPAADSASWMEAVDWIIHNVKASMKKDQVSKLFENFVKSPLSAQAVAQIKAIKAQLQELRSTCDLKGITEDLAHNVGQSEEERENALLTGRVDKIVLWQKILNRMEAVSRDARILSDFRRAAELSTATLFAPDFSTKHNEFEPRRSTAIAKTADIAILGADIHDPNISDHVHSARIKGEKLEQMYTTYSGRHLDALVAHILMYAGVDFDLFEKTKVSGQNTGRPLSVVPLEWHALSNFYSPMLRDMWKCFVPEHDQDGKPLKLQFYTELCELAARSISKPISISKTRPNLVNTLTKDIESLVLAVKELSYVGKGLNAEDVIKEYKRKAVQYTQEIVTPFNDINITTLSTVKEFVKSPAVMAECTRPVGTIVHPKAQGVGFEEAIVGRDLDRMGAITEAAPMSEIAELYNRVSDYTSVSGESLHVNLSINEAIQAALYDINRSALRINEAPIETLRASEVVKGSHFARLGDDYYAFVADTENTSLLLASGNTVVDTTMTSYGNVHGALSFGIVKPRASNALSTSFDDTVVSILEKSTEMLIGGYVPRAITVHAKTKADVSFAEENEKYAKRIALIPSTFARTQIIDNKLLRSMVKSPMINNVFKDTKVADVELLRFADHVEPSIREDAYSHLHVTAQRHIEVLGNTYSRQALKLFQAMLTRPLSVEEHVKLHRPEFAASAQAIASAITDTLKGFSAALRAVYIMMLFSELTRLPDPSNNPEESITLTGE